MKNSQPCLKAKMRSKEFQDNKLKGKKDSLGDFNPEWLRNVFQY